MACRGVQTDYAGLLNDAGATTMVRDDNRDESGRSNVSSQVTGVGVSNESEFGANEWLVEELYEQFRQDRNSVDKAWWPVLEAYHSAAENGAKPSEESAAAKPSSNDAHPVTAPTPVIGSQFSTCTVRTIERSACAFLCF